MEDGERQYQSHSSAQRTKANGMRRAETILRFIGKWLVQRSCDRILLVRNSFLSLSLVLRQRSVRCTDLQRNQKTMHVRYINQLLLIVRLWVPTDSNCIHHRTLTDALIHRHKHANCTVKPRPETRDPRPETDQYHVRRLASDNRAYQFRRWVCVCVRALVLECRFLSFAYLFVSTCRSKLFI